MYNVFMLPELYNHCNYNSITLHINTLNMTDTSTLNRDYFNNYLTLHHFIEHIYRVIVLTEGI